MSAADVLSGADRFHVARVRAESFCDSLPDGCINLIVVDPPYYGMKDEEWDNAWPSEEAFLAWMGEQAVRWRRALAVNGSLYVFAKPGPTRRGGTMASRVECLLAENFAVLNRIVWRKETDRGKHAATCKEAQRSFFPNTEHVIFAEQYGADNEEWTAACDAIRGEVFEPLRAYLDSERQSADIDKIAVNVACGFAASPGAMASRHYFSRSQWWLPTLEHYQAIRALAAGAFSREWEDLRAEYEHLAVEADRRCDEIEHLRRPFSVSTAVPCTDVWEYGTVPFYDGKHPCEKPHDMARDIISASSRPGDVVCDFFAGSGRFLEWAVKLGRRAIGCDMSEHWSAVAAERCAAAAADVPYKPPPRPDRVSVAKPLAPTKPRAGDSTISLFELLKVAS